MIIELANRNSTVTPQKKLMTLQLIKIIVLQQSTSNRIIVSYLTLLCQQHRIREKRAIKVPIILPFKLWFTFYISIVLIIGNFFIAVELSRDENGVSSSATTNTRPRKYKKQRRSEGMLYYFFVIFRYLCLTFNYTLILLL